MPPQSSYSLVLCGCRPVEYRPFRQCRYRPPTSSGPRQNSRSRSRMMNLFAAPSAIQKLTIEITTLCNLKCAGCPRTMGIANDSWVDQHMDLQLFQRIDRQSDVSGKSVSVRVDIGGRSIIKKNNQ